MLARGCENNAGRASGFARTVRGAELSLWSGVAGLFDSSTRRALRRCAAAGVSSLLSTLGAGSESDASLVFVEALDSAVSTGPEHKRELEGAGDAPGIDDEDATESLDGRGVEVGALS